MCSASDVDRSRWRKQQRCVVRFQDDELLCKTTTTTMVSPLDQFDSWNAHELWYGAKDIANFHLEARGLSRIMRIHLQALEDDDVVSSSSSSTTRSSSPMLAHDDYTRGLESRICLERQRRKHLTLRRIVRESVVLCRDDPTQLALLAQRCNSWATELAIKEAARDFHRAWVSDNVAEDDPHCCTVTRRSDRSLSSTQGNAALCGTQY